MKTKNIILILVTLFSVINVANAQFSYSTKKCKYTEIRPLNKSEWKHIEGTTYAPLSESAMMYQITEKCSGWYGQISAGGTFETSKSNFAPMAELAAGYDFCFGHESNFGAAVEGKAGISKMHGLQFKDLTEVKSKYMPYFGANAYLHLSKHSKTMFSLYGGAAYARVSSLYPSETEETAVRKVGHNTLMIEGGAQAMWRVAYGNFVGVKAFYQNTATEHVNQAQIGVAVVYKFKKVHKSAPISFRDWQNANKKINEARAAQAK